MQTKKRENLKIVGLLLRFTLIITLVISNVIPGTLLVAEAYSAPASSYVPLAAGYDDCYAVKPDGTIWAWGNNGNGQLGELTEDTDGKSSVPVQMFGAQGKGYMTGIISVTGGTFGGYALKSDGTVYSWGSNYYGKNGNNSDANSNSPVQVVSSSGTGYLDNIIAVSGGCFDGYALKSDGTVWAWGDNQYGQLGNNSCLESKVPIQVSNLRDVTAITSDSEFLCYALKKDGTVWVWGTSVIGKFKSNVPVQFKALNDVKALSAGESSGYALKKDGTVWAWGNNQYGQLVSDDINISTLI